MQKITLIPFHGPNHALLFLFVLILVLNFAGCAHHLKKTPSFEDGQLFLANGTPITLEAFSRQAADVDYILIGETHDAPHHHLMQAKLVEALAHSGMQLAVGFEMLYSRNQDDLKPFNRGEMDVAELEQASNWSVSWGYAFSMYAPIFQVAKRFGLPVYGLNISRETLNQVRAHGFERTRDMVPQKEVPDLPREVIWPMAEQIDAFHTMIELFKQWHPKHTETAGRKTVKTDGEKPPAPMALPAPDPKRFLLVQSLWDTSMAESAVSARYA
ncbi:ChaN family lipoprotein, partial [Desulfosarcina sp. OttesenSCG-928-A07]|nr:ChaN family lipoprotein [Desulfosarcina sp. OttesenSCG-928-A07]